MLKDIGLGFKTFFEAIGFVSKHKLGYFYLFPLALSVLISWVFYTFQSFITDWIIELIKLTFDVDLNETLDGWVATIIYWLFSISVFFLWVKVNRYFVLILLSPMLSILSEITEKKRTGKSYPFSLKQFFKDAWRGSIIATKNICIEIFLTMACWIITLFFPPASIVTIPFLILVSWYYMGFSFLDYNYERRKWSFWEGSQEIWRRKGVALVHGGLFIFLCYIPIFGIMVGSVWCVVASALAVTQEEEKRLQQL